MGSWLFKNYSNVGRLNCEEDINTLKYLASIANFIEFETESNEISLKHTIEFFKYLYQKFKFLTKLNKIKLNCLYDVIQNQEMFLHIHKCLNKYIFKKKWTTYTNLNQTSLLIKIDFSDSLLRIKQVKKLNKETPQINYFSLFAFKEKSYTNETISKFLLNENSNNYDFLLSSFLQENNFKYYLEYINYFIKKHKISNLKLSPLLIKNSIKKLDDLIESIKINNLNFIDFSFVIFADSGSELKKVLREIIYKINSINNKLKFDFILRFYVFSKRPLNFVIDELKLAFKQIITSIPTKINSYVILYLFERNIILSKKFSNNPHMHDHLQDINIKEKEEKYLKVKKLIKWINRNKNEINLERENSVERILTKYIHKIYTNINLEISHFLLTVHCKNNLIQKLKRKTILKNIFSFLTVKFKEKVYNKNDPISKNLISKDYLDIQDEFSFKMVRNPKYESQLHDDLVHIHFDQCFNLLRYNLKNDTDYFK